MLAVCLGHRESFIWRISPLQAIGTRNRLESISKQKMEQQELLESQVLEARVECEWLVVIILLYTHVFI